jgi:CRISPR/Cas system-associated endonuclease Cas3-HD
MVKSVNNKNTILIMEDENMHSGPIIPIPKEMQTLVEEYINTHKEHKILEAKLKRMREILEPFMKLNNLDTLISVAQVGKITLIDQDRPHVTSQFTYYSVDRVLPIISPEARQKCLVNLIDKEALEALEKLREVPAEVLNFKILNKSSRFSVLHTL